MSEPYYNIIQYIKSRKGMLVLLGVYTVILASWRVLKYTVGYDTEIWLLNPELFYYSAYEHGRFMMVFLNRLLPFLQGRLTLINVLTYINAFLYTVLFLAFLNIVTGRNFSKEKEPDDVETAGSRGLALRDLLCGIVLLSSPFFLEQYYFTLQAVPISIGFVFISLSFLTTRKALTAKLQGRTAFYTCLSVILVFFCVSIYQYFAIMYLVGAFICLITMEEKTEKKGAVANGIHCFCMLLAGLLLYYFVNKMVMGLLGVSPDSYLGNDWLRLPKATVLRRIYSAFIKSLFGHETVYTVSFTMAAIYLGYRTLRQKKRDLKDVYIVCLLLTPYLFTILFGNILLERTSMAFTYIAVFSYFLAVEDHLPIRLMYRPILLVLAISQTFLCRQLLDGDYVRYRNDVYMVTDLVNEFDISWDTPVFFKGIERTEENIEIKKGATIGASFFEFADVPGQVAQDRLYHLFALGGHPYQYPSTQLESIAQDFTFDTEYPDGVYWKKTEYGIIINLGE